MDGTPIRNLDQPRSLFGRQWPSQVDVPLNSIEHYVFRFAIGAIRGVYSRVPQIDRNFLERPSFPASVHPKRDRSAGPQAGEQKVVRRWSRVRAACRGRFIGDHPMRTRENFLCESSAAAANDYTSDAFLFGCRRHFLMRVAHSASCRCLLPINLHRQRRAHKCSGLCRPSDECKCSIVRDGEQYRTAQSTAVRPRYP